MSSGGARICGRMSDPEGMRTEVEMQKNPADHM